MKKLIYLISISVLITLTCVYSCRKTEDNQKNKVQSQSKLLKKGAGNCSCDLTFINTNCPSCVLTNFMRNQSSKQYIINWTECTSNDPNWTGPCTAAGQAGFSATITFCYGSSATQGSSSECNLYMDIDWLPNCIQQCQSIYPYCVKFRAACTQNGQDVTLTLLDEDPVIESTITYTISGDPIIEIGCSKDDGMGHTYFYKCKGSF